MSQTAEAIQADDTDCFRQGGHICCLDEEKKKKTGGGGGNSKYRNESGELDCSVSARNVNTLSIPVLVNLFLAHRTKKSY
jgi:hypothetical protein